MSGNADSGRTLSAVSALCTFALIALFAVLSALLVAIGVRGYQQVTVNAHDTAQTRTAAGYLRNKVKAYDAPGAVSVRAEGGLTVLSLSGAEDGAFVTDIYCYDGALREQYREAAAPFEPSFGEDIAEAAVFTAEESAGAWTLRVTDMEGGTISIVVASRGGM